MSVETHPLTLIDPVCGKPWAHARRVPLPTDRVDAEDWEHLDGTSVGNADLIRCESCNRLIEMPEVVLMTRAENYRPRAEAQGTRTGADPMRKETTMAL